MTDERAHFLIAVLAAVAAAACFKPLPKFPAADAAVDATSGNASEARDATSDTGSDQGQPDGSSAVPPAPPEPPAMDARNVTPADVATSADVADGNALTCDGGSRQCGNACIGPTQCCADSECPVARGAGRCTAGACSVRACEVGFRDCDGLYSNGCERRTELAYCENVIGEGKNLCGGLYSPVRRDGLHAFPISSSTAFEVLRFGIYTQNAGSKLSFALYSDNAGKPGTLILVSRTATTAANRATLAAIDDPKILSSGKFWVAFLADTEMEVCTTKGNESHPWFSTFYPFTSAFPHVFPVDQAMMANGPVMNIFLVTRPP